MLNTLIEEGIVVPQLGGKTGTAHLLYIKGKACRDSCAKPYVCCSHGDCTSQVDASGDLCERGGGGVALKVCMDGDAGHITK